jgi:phosphoglycolate phosphatase
MRPRYRLVLFDFDGTLCDSFAWFRRVLGEVAERFAFRSPRCEEIEALRHLGAREILARLGVPAWRLPAIAAHMRALKARDASTIPLFPGVDAMLARLHAQGVIVALVSSDAEVNIRRGLGAESAARVRHWGLRRGAVRQGAADARGAARGRRAGSNGTRRGRRGARRRGGA